jgi:NADH-quinone oxidoreductase subunit C
MTLICHDQTLGQCIDFLKHHTNSLLTMLLEITAVDYPQKQMRYEVVYILCSLQYNYRLRLKVIVHEVVSLTSLTPFYLASDWHEREVWDMFGIFFNNHGRLRRILTDYGFTHFPLRKDFPSIGFQEMRYSESLQKTVYEPIELVTPQLLYND